MRWRFVAKAIVVLLFGSTLLAQSTDPAKLVAVAESLFADLADAHYVLFTIDSGFFSTYQRNDRTAWQEIASRKQTELASRLAEIPVDSLSPIDHRALARIRAELADFAESGPSSSAANPNKCTDAAHPSLAYDALRMSLYSCFGELAEHLQFEGHPLNRVAAIDLLGNLPEPSRRKALFLTFLPLWRSINAENQPASPYRRLLALASSSSSPEDSRIAAAAKTLGVTPAQVESWLEQILDAWRQSTPGKPIEPWDFFYNYSAADRSLDSIIPADSLQGISQRYYRDLGVDLSAAGVLHDAKPRPGKAPLAYTDFLTVGRAIDNAWRPSVVRVSTNNARGGLGQLNEFIHEDGHAAHMLALHTRPAFMDLGDDLFVEAFADVASWSTDDPAWQRKYLGKSAAPSSSPVDSFSGVMLDVAWGLFELRMLRDPKSDPNALWTDITSHYLHIVPHPEFSWWALRVQLVHLPGYMINYGLGAVLTADLRAQVEKSIGPFNTGNPRWFPWLAENLLHSGTEHETSDLLRTFFSRPVSPAALLSQLRPKPAGPASCLR